MNEKTILKRTGKTSDSWFKALDDAGLQESPHKSIAEYLYESAGVTEWWSQSITNAYEKHIGRRVLGQTGDGSFQIGVSKSIDAPVSVVWDYLESQSGLELITGHSAPGTLSELDDKFPSGIRAKTTTYKSDSHARLQWSEKDWPNHSILQIRVTEKTNGKTTLTFHQERLPSAQARETMREKWRQAAHHITSEIRDS